MFTYPALPEIPPAHPALPSGTLGTPKDPICDPKQPQHKGKVAFFGWWGIPGVDL